MMMYLFKLLEGVIIKIVTLHNVVRLWFTDF